MQNDDMLKEIYRLTLDNNKQLKKMRRATFLHRIFTLVLYVALLLVPLWLYTQYLAPVVEEALRTIDAVQGTGAEASAQFDSLQDMWRELQERFGSSQ